MPCNGLLLTNHSPGEFWGMPWGMIHQSRLLSTWLLLLRRLLLLLLLPPPPRLCCAANQTYHVVYTTAAGPPARLYGVKTRSGSLRWEYKLPNASVALQDVAGPWDFDFGSTVISRASTNGTSASVGHVSTSAVMVLAVNQPNSNSSWLQAVAIASGTPAWQSQVLNGTQLAELVLQDDLLLATSADAGSVLAWQPQNGTLLWRRDGPFCTTPSPIATLFEGRQLLVMSESCSDLSGLVAVDVATGQEQWAGWSPPKYARPNGNCSSFEVARGSVFFGCSCSIEAKKRGHNSAGGSDVSGRVGSSQHQHQQGPAHDPTGPSDTPGAPDVGHKASITTGVCLYALHSRQGKVRWVVPVPGNASFPSGAQAWGMAPLVREGLAMFFASDRVFAVDADSGKLQWVYQLPVGEALQPWQVPAVDSASGTLVLAAQLQPPQPPGAQVDDATVSGGGVSKTGLSAVSLKDGRLLWHRMMNGTGQQPASGAAGGAQQLLLSQGRVFAEACRGSRCCLRGLNVTTGKQRWGMCLDALQGDDATHPHAKFAIWLVTLITVGSIALLILGACLVYVQRW